MLGVLGAPAARRARLDAAPLGRGRRTCEPADFTVLTMPERFAAIGDPHAGIDEAAGSLEALLELAARDEAAGLGDAPWPPHFRKMDGEAPRVAPSRARRGRGRRRRTRAAKAPREKMPLVVVANSPNKEAALAGLERWKARHPEAAQLLAVDDVLVDSMRGRSSTWTRVRVNLRHVPEDAASAAGAARPRRRPDARVAGLEKAVARWRACFPQRDDVGEPP